MVRLPRSLVGSLLLLFCLAAVQAGSARACELKPTYLADEGFLVEGEGVKALVDGAGIRKSIAPRRIVAIHVPDAGASPDYFGEPGSRDALIRLLRSAGITVLEEPLDSISVPAM